MADTMQFDLVSPERRLASVQATAVQIPGADGDMTAMPDHSPTITTLRPGILSVTHAGGTDEYVVLGGFADVSANAVTVLAERALPKAEMTRQTYDGLVADYRASHEKARETFVNEPGPVDDAAKLLADMVALGEHINL